MRGKKAGSMIRNDIEAGAAKMTGDISLYPVKSGRQKMGLAFYYSIAGGEKKRAQVLGNSEEELMEKAEKYLAKKNAEYLEEKEKIRKAGEERDRPLTFGEVGSMWYAEYVKKNISYSSKESRGCSLNRITEVIGGCLIRDIDDKAAENMIRSCSAKGDGTFYSRSHVDKLQQVFRLVMEYGIENGYCRKMPEKAVFDERLTEPDKDRKFLDEEQLREVRRALKDNPKYITLADLLWASGLRQEEAFALKISDFEDMKDGWVKIDIYKTVVKADKNVYKIVNKTKTKRSRRAVFVPKEIYGIIRAYYDKCVSEETEEEKMLRQANGTEGCIFVDEDMMPVRKIRFEQNFERYLKKKGIDYKVTLHMFRHTFVSIQADNMPLDKVALFIGDSLATTNNMYQSLTNKAKETLCDNTSRLYERLEA